MIRTIRHIAYILCTVTSLVLILGASAWVQYIYTRTNLPLTYRLDPFIFLAMLLYGVVKVESFYRPFLKPWTVK
jgi:hypothetical protein